MTNSMFFAENLGAQQPDQSNCWYQYRIDRSIPARADRLTLVHVVKSQYIVCETILEHDIMVHRDHLIAVVF